MTSLVQAFSLDKKPKVIPLVNFKLNLGETVIQFLSCFEEYCAVMYPRSTKVMVPFLCTFGGHGMEYDEVKEKCYSGLEKNWKKKKKRVES